jgi:transposase
MREKYKVILTKEERDILKYIVHKGKAAARKIMHARVLLKADESGGNNFTDKEIVEALDVGRATVERIRTAFVENGLEVALDRKERVVGPTPRKFDGEKEAHLVALACSKPPEGRAQWTMQLLADRLVELKIFDSVSDETVRKTLKKTKLNLG